MKSKTRKCNVTDDQSELLNIPSYFTEKYSDKKTVEIITSFNNSNKLEDQISIIQNLSTQLKKSTEDDLKPILDIFVYLFVNSSPKNAIKKTILRTFANVRNLNAQISIEVSQQLLQLLHSVISETDKNRLNNCVNSVNDCFNNFPAGIIAASLILDDIFKFLIYCLKFFVDNLSGVTSPIDLQENYNYIHNNSRALVAVSQQCENSKLIIPNYINDISVYCIKIFNNPNIFFDTKNNCSILLITSINLIEENGYISILQLSFNEIESKYGINYIDIKDDIVLICIYAGILNTATSIQFFSYNDSFNESYIYKITDVLLQICKTSADKPSIILGANRTLSLVCRCLNNLNGNDFMQMLKSLLDHVWTQLDHYIDTVRHVAKIILTSLVKASYVRKTDEQTLAVKILIENVFTLSYEKRSKYVALSVLSTEIGCELLLRKIPNLLHNMMSYFSKELSYIISCYESLMRKHLEEVDESVWVATWVEPIVKKLKIDIDDINTEGKNLQNLLITALKLRPIILDIIFLQLFNNPKEIILSTILNCAITARKLGFTSKNIENKWRGILDPKIIEQAKCEKIDEIRISSLALITESHKSTEIFIKFEFDFITSFLHYSISSQEPSTRQQILFLIKKFLTRYTESYYGIIRDYNKLKTTDELNQLNILKDQKDTYESFIFEFRKSILESMFPGSSFSRRILCLEILTMIEPILNEVLKNINDAPEILWTQNEIDTVLLCLHDSYESNKQLATKILEKCPVNLLKLHDVENTKKFIDGALKLAISAKPADSQTAAYLFEMCMFSPVLKEVLAELLSLNSNDLKFSKEFYLITFLFNSLKNQIAVGKNNLLKAAASNPMHGTLFCLRHLLEKYLFTTNIIDSHWKNLINEIITNCFEVSEIVGPVVNNSSPEGHLPMDTESCNDDTEDATVTAQMLLVCSWRSIKEISLLLGEITLKLNIESENQTGLITEAQILKIGEHFTVLLTETKHRGAFEQAYVGFVKVCTRLWKCKSEILHQLPVTWLNDIIKAISDPSSSQNTKLCATRRSAGVPFMIQAIVASELQTGGSTNFHHCMTTLLQFANYSGDNIEVRTHSMNILRALYRHTQLGEEISPYTSEGLIVAINAFSRQTWAERNSATLLFSSLMTRIFGVQRSKDTDQISIRNKMTARVFFLRHPKLHSFLLEHLKELTDKNCETYKLVALYPILLLLARLYPANNNENELDNLLQDFIPYVKLCADNKYLKTRELAAKALTNLVAPEQKLNLLNELFYEINKNSNNKNKLHGILLQIFYLLPSIENIEKTINISKFINYSSWIIVYNNPNSCAIICALYMQIISILLEKPARDFYAFIKQKFGPESVIQHKKSFEDLSVKLSSQEDYVQNNCIVGIYLYSTESTRLQLNLLRYRHFNNYNNANISHYLITKLKHSNIKVVEFVINVLLYYFDKINRSNKSIKYILDNLEIPDNEIISSNLFNEDFKYLICFEITKNHKYFYETFKSICLTHKELINKAFLLISFFKQSFANEHIVNVYMNYFRLLVKNYSTNDEIACAVINCIRIIFKNTSQLEVMANLTIFDKYFEVLHECSLPKYSVNCRYALALFFTEDHLKHLWLEDGHNIIDIDSLINAWKIIMQLSVDPELIVRNTISDLIHTRTVAEKSRELLMDKCYNYLRSVSVKKLILLLLFWSVTDFGTLDITEDDEGGQIFEKGETSVCAENYSLNKLAASKLSSLIICKNITDFRKTIKIIITIIRQETTMFDLDVDDFETLLKYILKDIKKHPNKIRESIIKQMKPYKEVEPLVHFKFKNIFTNILPRDFKWED